MKKIYGILVGVNGQNRVWQSRFVLIKGVLLLRGRFYLYFCSFFDNIFWNGSFFSDIMAQLAALAQNAPPPASEFSENFHTAIFPFAIIF
jgi:hypothetical protein